MRAWVGGVKGQLMGGNRSGSTGGSLLAAFGQDWAQNMANGSVAMGSDRARAGAGSSEGRQAGRLVKADIGSRHGVD